MIGETSGEIGHRKAGELCGGETRIKQQEVLYWFTVKELEELSVDYLFIMEKRTLESSGR